MNAKRENGVAGAARDRGNQLYTSRKKLAADFTDNTDYANQELKIDRERRQQREKSRSFRLFCFSFAALYDSSLLR
jgi:hypothetical protein